VLLVEDENPLRAAVSKIDAGHTDPMVVPVFGSLFEPDGAAEAHPVPYPRSLVARNPLLVDCSLSGKHVAA
jgi:hypothetical protein